MPTITLPLAGWGVVGAGWGFCNCGVVAGGCVGLVAGREGTFSKPPGLGGVVGGACWGGCAGGVAGGACCCVGSCAPIHGRQDAQRQTATTALRKSLGILMRAYLSTLCSRLRELYFVVGTQAKI